jgi:integrase
LTPEVSLATARERQLGARSLLKSGVDPGEFKKQAKRAANIAGANTFEAIAREWFLKFSTGWAESHSSRVLLRLENDLFPWLGSRPIAAIEADELLETIRRIEARGALDSAHRCHGYCGQIFRYAIATARAKRNPAADLRGALPPAKGGHFASIVDPDRVGELLRAIDGYEGGLVTRSALRLAPLTFVRPGELRTAEWAHVDLRTNEWRIPAERMKMNEDLIVPLSRQAVAVIQELQPQTRAGKYLFPSLQGAHRPMSENTINGALRRLGYSSDQMTGHGFRAMARTLLDEVLGYRVEWIEHQLAHEVKDPNGRAYNRTAFLKARKEMMQGWADYLVRLKEGAVS